MNYIPTSIESDFLQSASGEVELLPPSMREEIVPQAGAQMGFSNGNPKATTRKAMEDAKEGKTVKGFRNVNTLVADLED